jgi:hypothetical protein
MPKSGTRDSCQKCRIPESRSATPSLVLVYDLEQWLPVYFTVASGIVLACLRRWRTVRTALLCVLICLGANKQVMVHLLKLKPEKSWAATNVLLTW